MSLNDTNIKELVLSQFRGSDNTSDDYNIDPAHLLNAQNLDFTVAENGMVQAGTRTGTAVAIGAAANTLAAVPSLASWLFVTGGVQTGYLAYLTFSGPNPDIVFLSQNSATIPTSFVAAASGTISANFAIDGLRFFFALQSAVIGGPGTFSGEVYGVIPNAFEQLFSGATTTTVTPAVGGASTGVITQGTHRVGFVFTTLNGYTGVLNPVTSTSSNVWNFSTFTTTDGTRNVTVNIGPFPGSYSGQTVQVVMTTTANLNKVFLVPGATATLSGATPTVHIIVSITDSDLAATGTDVTQNQNLLAATAGLAAPFNPSALFIYSSRMAYCTYDASNFPVLYFSDQNNYQSLTAAFHAIYLEGHQVPIQGASLGGVCYIATLSGLYATQDNGGLPSTWIPPSRVDGSVGILSASCMSASTQILGTATGRIILCAEKGLFIFKGGTFPEIPLSYWQTTDWNRINWAAPWQVQVVDDVYRQKIRVLAPLKSYVIGATNANPIVITTSATQSSATGTPLPGPHLIPSVSGVATIQVTITGVLGNTNANGTFTATILSPTTFSIPVAGSGTYTSGGIVTPASQNAEMTWTYPVGDEPGQPFYSLNSWASYPPNSIGIVRNINTEIDETWYGPAASGKFLRRVVPSDALQYRDQDLNGNPVAISSVLETVLIPGTADTNRNIHDYHGAHFRVSGSGSLNVTAFSLDHSLSVVPAASPLTLSLTPGQEVLMKWFLRNEQQSIQLSTNAVDAFFVLSRLKAYYTDSLPMR